VIQEITGINERFSVYQISWDGWSVWVNAPVCIGRLGPMRGELYYSGCNDGDVVTREGFTSWCERILKTFNIRVPEVARPQWSKKGSQA
jgi:hypothetical protein